MKLSKVTMTGADDSTKQESLFELSAKYPYAEWAILLSRNSAGRNRFPSLNWMNRLSELDSDFYDFEMQYAGHLCGSYVREFLMGNTGFIKEIGDIWELFQRIQINTHGIGHEYDKKGLLNVLAKYPEKEFIFQYDNANKEILDYVVANSSASVSALFDLSHGAGILPEEWPLPIDGVKCGYAGGLSPDNVNEQIKLIESKIDDAEIWIDMETKVRSNNDKLFDLTKVESVFETCKAHIK